MKKILLTGFLAIAFFSCDITTSDQASLAPAVALDNSAGVQSAVLSGYRRLWEFDFYGQQANLHGDVFADNVEIVNRTGRYEQEWINGVGVYADRWAVAYRAINDANYVIKYLPLLDTLNTQRVPKNAASATTLWADDYLTHLKGEALFVRAFSYMELLRVYSYEPGREVNGWNLGVVLRDTPTEKVSDNDNRSRSTNLECYQFVENDLLQAIASLKTSPQLVAAGAWPTALGTYSPIFRANKATAHALLARLYLYWGRYADADTQAGLALSFLTAPAPMAAGTVVGSWALTPHPESIFELEIRPTDFSGVSGQNDSMHSITQNALSGSQYCLAASVELLAAHEAGDVRRNVYVTSTATLSKPQVRKWQGEKGTFVENIPVIRKAEMYLIQAESRARLANDGGAQTAVNAIRTNRGLAATSLTGTALISLIMNERRVEFAFEGHRFFDLKRLGMDVPKPLASGVSTLPYSDFRMLQQIQNDQVILNPNILQNPGY